MSTAEAAAEGRGMEKMKEKEVKNKIK